MGKFAKGSYSDVVMSFGIHKEEQIGSISNSYLNYLLNQDWFEGKDEFDAVQDEMQWRRDNNIYIGD